MSAYLHQRDLLFIVETLMPGSAHPEQAAGRLQGDKTGLETMLDEPRLFQRSKVMGLPLKPTFIKE